MHARLRMMKNHSSRPPWLREHSVLFLLLVCAAILRCFEASLPYLKLHETGFQETLALNHLELGVLENHFLSVMAEVDSTKYYHVSHPPLLQLVLTLSYALFGVSERVARLTILPFSLGSVALVYSLAARKLSRPIAGYAAFFMTFSLLPAYFGRIVNFEVITLFFVLLYYYLFLCYRKKPTRLGLFLLIATLLLGCLSDWPFYFILPGTLLYVLLEGDRWDKRLRGLILPVLLLGAGFLMVVLYGGYQRFVTDWMVLLRHGENRTGFDLLLDGSFYLRLFSRVMRYAPLATIAAVIGVLLSIDRRPRYFTAVLPLLVVPILYIGIFAQSADRHEWNLYYLAPSLALFSGIALELVLSRRTSLRLLVIGMLTLILGSSNFRFHERAKRTVFNSLYEVSVFLSDQLPENSLVFSTILCQVSYYCHGKAAVIFPFAKGDLTQHDYDCILFDRVPATAKRNRLALAVAEKSGNTYQSIVRATRYELICQESLFEGHLFLDEETVGGDDNRLEQIGREVRLSRHQPAQAPSRPIATGEREIEEGDSLAFSIGLGTSKGAPGAASGGAVFTILLHHDGDRKEIFRRYIEEPTNSAERDWHDVRIDLSPHVGKVSIEFLTRPAPSQGATTSRPLWGDPILKKGSEHVELSELRPMQYPR